MRRGLIVGMISIVAAAAGPSAVSADTWVMRISTENSDTHFHTRVVGGFAEALAERTRGRIEVRYSPGARLYKDRDAVRALQLDHLEMAVPGTWQLDRLASGTAGRFSSRRRRTASGREG